jgi:salicylate hydroxylase
MAPVRVAIVGGGIGGLTAALALRGVGAEADVYEQAPGLGEVGAGVAITPASQRVLRRLGVGDEVSRRGAPVAGVRLHHPDGSVVTRQDAGAARSPLGLYRPDLVEILAAALPDGALHTGHRCVAVSQGDRSAHVTFDNGGAVEADAVVGADGIHSVVQGQVTQARPPVFSGRISYRGVLPAARMPGWERDEVGMWKGNGKTFLTFPLRAGELRNFVGHVPADERMRESWSAPCDPADLAAEFSGWDARLGELFSGVETAFRWGLYDRDPLPRWTNGRLTLLGDAAHAMLPHLGQGANQAIEDAFALAILLRGVSADDLPGALVRYEQLRRERTDLIQQGSRVNGNRLEAGDPARLARPGIGIDDGYDIEAEAEARR